MIGKLRGIVWVGSFSIIFLFIPSLAIKIWEYLTEAPWPNKSWLFYLGGAFLLIIFAGNRWRKRKEILKNPVLVESPILIAKQRLAKGEISIEEFRQIRQELIEI